MKTRTVRPAGFTLVELLMVIMIIGMLAALITAAAMFSLKAARRAGIKVEIGNLDMAMQSYSNQFGNEFPPCMAPGPPTRSDQFYRAVRKRFPRYIGNYANAQTALLAAYGGTGLCNLDNMDAAESLVFWLGGLPTPPGGVNSSKLWGFSASPTNPFLVSGAATGRLAKLYDFEESRLTDIDGDGWLEYVPPGLTNKAQIPPYVYFDAANYSWGVPGSFSYPSYASNASEWGTVYPYATFPATATAAPIFANPKKFQIITSGLDADYGGSQYDQARTTFPPIVPLGGSNSVLPILTPGENDNQTSFADGVLEDEVGI